MLAFSFFNLNGSELPHEELVIDYQHLHENLNNFCKNRTPENVNNIVAVYVNSIVSPNDSTQNVHRRCLDYNTSAVIIAITQLKSLKLFKELIDKGADPDVIYRTSERHGNLNQILNYLKKKAKYDGDLSQPFANMLIYLKTKRQLKLEKQLKDRLGLPNNDEQLSTEELSVEQQLRLMEELQLIQRGILRDNPQELSLLVRMLLNDVKDRI